MIAGGGSQSAVGSALAWLQGALLGSVATAVAVIAVASVGFLMIGGRIDMRRAAQVVLGCFVLFGASSVAGALQSLAQGVAPPAPPPVAAQPSPAPAPQPAPQAYDPYAGAALMSR
jgi:type IV secretory pathway VirB2 component (pilin)